MNVPFTYVLLALFGESHRLPYSPLDPLPPAQESDLISYFLEVETLLETRSTTLCGDEYQRALELKSQLQSALDKERDDLYFPDALTSQTLMEISLLENASRFKCSSDEYEIVSADYLMSRIGSEEHHSHGAGVNDSYWNPEYIISIRNDWEENEYAIYLPDFFDEGTFEEIKREVQYLWESPLIEANCNLDGINRIGGYIHWDAQRPAGEQLYSLVSGNRPFRLWLSALAERSFWPADFPLELREYGPDSQGMQCHRDLAMYADPLGDLEIVVTVSQSERSTCAFGWYDRKGNYKQVKPAPNSVTVVRPNAAVHCVSGTGGGRREMLKFIMVGDYEKPRAFNYYVGNECPRTHRNVREVEKRREDHPLRRREKERDWELAAGERLEM